MTVRSGFLWRAAPWVVLLLGFGGAALVVCSPAADDDTQRPVAAKPRPSEPRPLPPPPSRHVQRWLAADLTPSPTVPQNPAAKQPVVAPQLAGKLAVSAASAASAASTPETPHGEPVEASNIGEVLAVAEELLRVSPLLPSEGVAESDPLSRHNDAAIRLSTYNSEPVAAAERLLAPALDDRSDLPVSADEVAATAWAIGEPGPEVVGLLPDADVATRFRPNEVLASFIADTRVTPTQARRLFDLRTSVHLEPEPPDLEPTPPARLCLVADAEPLPPVQPAVHVVVDEPPSRPVAPEVRLNLSVDDSPATLPPTTTQVAMRPSAGEAKPIAPPVRLSLVAESPDGPTLRLKPPGDPAQ